MGFVLAETRALGSESGDRSFQPWSGVRRRTAGRDPGLHAQQRLLARV